MKNHPTFDVQFTCACGNQFVLDFPINKPQRAALCAACSVPLNAKRGTLITYAAPERAIADAIYADSVLERGGVYTLYKIKRWQHGAYVHLQEFPNRRFDWRLFKSVSTEGKK